LAYHRRAQSNQWNPIPTLGPYPRLEFADEQEQCQQKDQKARHQIEDEREASPQQAQLLPACCSSAGVSTSPHRRSGTLFPYRASSSEWSLRLRATLHHLPMSVLVVYELEFVDVNHHRSQR
jgi:hypothetical protein